MRSADRIPLILDALERRWRQTPSLSLGQLLDAAFEHPEDRHPLFDASDALMLRLLDADAEAQPGDSIDSLLAATRRQWINDSDSRLCQLLVNVYRRTYPTDAHWLFNVEDGHLLERLGVESEAERRYVADEPAARSRGWSEWEQDFARNLRHKDVRLLAQTDRPSMAGDYDAEMDRWRERQARRPKDERGGSLDA